MVGYLDRFTGMGTGLSAADIQALILRHERKKHAILERARAEVCLVG